MWLLKPLTSHHLVEVAKTAHEKVIAVEGIITAIAPALNHSRKFECFEPHFSGASLNILPQLT